MHLDLGAELSRTTNNAPSKNSDLCNWKHLEELAHGIALQESQLLRAEHHFRSRLEPGLTSTRALTLKCYQLGETVETASRNPVTHSLATRLNRKFPATVLTLARRQGNFPDCIGTGSIPPTYEFTRRSGNNTRQQYRNHELPSKPMVKPP
jgi:hypothetical protein